MKKDYSAGTPVEDVRMNYEVRARYRARTNPGTTAHAQTAYRIA